MIIKTLATGSTGNCYGISDGFTHILIECGIPIAKIKKLLNYQLHKVKACLVSHCHGDHAKAALDLLKLGVPVVCNSQTAKTLDLKGDCLHVLDSNKPMQIGSLICTPFALNHDVDCFGYLIESNQIKDKLLFITDTDMIPHTFKKVTHYLVECNYSEEQLAKSNINARQKDRILNGHMSIETLEGYFNNDVVDMSHAREIHLIHTSDRHGDDFQERIFELTGIPTTQH